MTKILVVDDEQDLREILRFNLQGEGFEVSTAGSAEEALAMMEGEEAVRYDLVLLDVMMERMSGYEMAEHRTRRARRPVGRLCPWSGRLYHQAFCIRHRVGSHQGSAEADTAHTCQRNDFWRTEHRHSQHARMRGGKRGGTDAKRVYDTLPAGTTPRILFHARGNHDPSVA